MSWCKVSSLTASVAKSMKNQTYPSTRRRLLVAAEGVIVEGWDVEYFLKKALVRPEYSNLREVMTDVAAWAEVQG